MQRFEDRLTRVESQQEALRAHYDRLYALNVDAIGQLTRRFDDVVDVLSNAQRPFPRLVNIREADTPTEIPVMSWHQQLARRQVPMHKAGIFSLLAVIIAEVLRALADGTIRFH